MTKIRVLHILNELRLSGMEMMLLNSASEWSKHNIEIEILATGKNIGVAAKSLQKAGYKTHHISFVENRRSSFFKLKRFFKLNRYDIVHIHTELNFLIHVLNARLTGHKVIIRTFHSNFKPRLLGHYRRLADRLIAKFLKVNYLSVGDSVAENEKRNYYTNSTVIYNWYDDKRFYLRSDQERVKKRKDINISESKIVITTIGNCAPIKRHDLVIKALSLLPETIDWLYLHIGLEEKNLPERKLASDLNILKRCNFLGSVQNVEDLLLISDIYIMSSKTEGLGIAAIEAIASGVPTILTKVPGLVDLIDKVDDVIGINSSPKDLAKAIVKLTKLDSSNKARIRERNNKTAVDLFSMKNKVYEYSIFYKSLI